MSYIIVNTPGNHYLAATPGEPGIISRRKGKQFYGLMDGKKNHKCKAITFKTEEEAKHFIWNSSALLGDSWHPMPTDTRLTKALKPLN